MPDVSVITATDAFKIGALRDLFIGVWRAKPPRGAARSFETALLSIGKRWSRVSLLNISEAGAELPDAEERASLLGALRRYQSQLQCAALVIEAKGLKGVAIRASVTSITMITRAGHPTGTFATVDEAAAWLTPHLLENGGLSVSRYEIIGAVKKLRQTSM
jgi:hypothetical protein